MKANEAASGLAYPAALYSAGKKALYDQLGNDEARARAMNAAIQKVKKDNCVGNRGKDLEVQACGLSREAAEKLLKVVRVQREYK